MDGNKSKTRNIKYVKRKGSLVETAEEMPKNLLYLTSPLRDPIWEEVNVRTYNGCKSY